jgi:hypothetical protein
LARYSEGESVKKLPRECATVLVLSGVLSGANIQAAQSIPSPSHDVLAWPRMSVRDFGCFLEETFDFKDPKFNCSLKNYKPNGDPCADGYYEGFEFPDELARKVHPLLDNIELTWEHGELQSISLSFKQKIDADVLRRAFHVPEETSYPKNVLDVDVQDCSRDGVCLLIQGFEHVGAADVECAGAAD